VPLFTKQYKLVLARVNEALVELGNVTASLAENKPQPTGTSEFMPNVTSELSASETEY